MSRLGIHHEPRAPRSGIVAIWRLLIAASGAVGVWLAALQHDVWWTALSQLASVAVAVTYAVLAAHVRVPSSARLPYAAPWLRGMLATLMLLVSIAYLAMPRADLSDPYSIVEHLLTPALVVIDFLVVGHLRDGVRWWHPLTWLVPPAAYLGWYVAADLGVYAALDPGRPTEFVPRTLMLLVLVLASGAFVYTADRSRTLVRQMAAAA